MVKDYFHVVLIWILRLIHENLIRETNGYIIVKGITKNCREKSVGI